MLQHEDLPAALAAMLSDKLSSGTPLDAKAEETLRATMARELSTPKVRRAVVSDLAKVLQLSTCKTHSQHMKLFSSLASTPLCY